MPPAKAAMSQISKVRQRSHWTVKITVDLEIQKESVKGQVPPFTSLTDEMSMQYVLRKPTSKGEIITLESPSKLASDIQTGWNDVVPEINSEVSTTGRSQLDALVGWIESAHGSETFYQLKSCVSTAHRGLWLAESRRVLGTNGVRWLVQICEVFSCCDLEGSRRCDTDKNIHDQFGKSSRWIDVEVKSIRYFNCIRSITSALKYW